LFPVFSVSKSVTALTALRFVDRGAIGFGTPIAEVWQEFGVHQKHDITLGEVLSHTAGLSRLPPTETVEELCDWDRMVRAVECMTPIDRGIPAYHALTFGWIVGETIRRVADDGRDFGEIMRAELTSDSAPDFWFGLPDEAEPRVVTVVRQNPPTDESPLAHALPARFGVSQTVYGHTDVRRACLPAVNGIGNAVTLAAIHADAASGASISTSLLAESTRRWSAGIDALMGTYVARGAGFYVSAPESHDERQPFQPGSGAFGHPGSGGSLAWGDRQRGVGVAICRSKLTPSGWRDESMQRLIHAIGATLESV